MAQPDPKRVFIVYGRNTKAYEAMQLFLRSLKLDPLTFEEVRNKLGGSPFVGNIIRAGMEQARAIVVLFTPDEYACLHPGLRASHDKSDDLHRWQPRPNVILEAGMALAVDESRTILVILGHEVTLASDLHGRHFISLNNSTDARGKLRDALVGVGAAVDQATSNWHNPAIAGDFDICLKPPTLPEVSTSSPFQEHESWPGALPTESAKLYSPTPQQSEIVVLEAKYGIRDHRIDVTKALNMSVKNGKLHVLVSNQLVPHDPCLNMQKDIIVRYRYKNDEHTKTVAEGDDLDLP